MRAIGLDPSTATGFCIVDAHGSVMLAKEISSDKKANWARFDEIAQEICTMLKTGDVVAIEGYAYNAKGRGVEFQYGLGAVIRVALHQNKIPFVEVAPTALKKFAGAKGNAPKADVAKAVEAKWGYWWESDNITDSYVLAMYAREHYMRGGGK